MCDDFAHELGRVVVVQICKSLNYNAVQASACDALVDILRRYIEYLGEKSHFYAELDSRTESNFLDVRLALQDANVNNFIELMTFHANWPETPFPKAVPPFPVQKKKKKKPELESQTPRPEHIPEFLPPFPDPRTYVSTPVREERVIDPRTVRKLKGKRKRQVEESLTAMTASQNVAPVPAVVNYDATRDQKTSQSLASINFGAANASARNNPYLLPPKTRSTPAPTPVKPNARYLKFADDGAEVRSSLEDQAHPPTLGDETERHKKMQKCERILSLAHTSGIDSYGETRDDDDTSNAGGRDDD